MSAGIAVKNGHADRLDPAAWPRRGSPQPGSPQELIDRTRSVLRTIQRSPARVRAYFRPEPVRYAA